jgi:hypothetical protein
MENTIIPPLSASRRKKIKEVVKFHHGIEADDYDLDWIDKMLRNHYSVLHDQNVISNLVTVNIGKILLKHRDKIGSIEFERMTMDKLIFRYLTFSSMCYRAGIPIATISLCRTALEGGLKEKIAEKIANDEKGIWEVIEELSNLKLWQLIRRAEDKNIITKDEIERFFTIGEKMKKIIPNPRSLLDKYIHADLPTIIAFLEEIGANTEVIGDVGFIEKKKIQAEAFIDKIAVFVLTATTRIAERLYFSNKK